jgi:hypothetical protein
MARRSNETATYFAQKKLLGKAHTSNLLADVSESKPSSVQLGSTTIFGESIPNSPSKTLYVSQNTVQYVEFELEALTESYYDANATGGGSGGENPPDESQQSSGYHAYALKLPTGYESEQNNDNDKKSTGYFINEQLLYSTLGRLQLVPFNFSTDNPNPYQPTLYRSDGTEIPLLSTIDWQVDAYNGILFVQDYDANSVPDKVRAFLYIGDMLDETLGSAASSGDLNYVQSTSSDYLSATGSMSFSGGEGYNFNTSDVGSDTFFFVSGSLDGQNKSVFGGDVVVSGNLKLDSISSTYLDTKGIDHQFALNFYTGSFSAINESGEIERRSYISPVYAKSTGSNSDLEYVARFSGAPESFFNVLENGFYGPKAVPVSGSTTNATIIFVHDANNSNILTNNHWFIFDSTHQGDPEQINHRTNGTVNAYDGGSYSIRSSYLADIVADANYSYNFLSSGDFNVNFENLIIEDMTDLGTTGGLLLNGNLEAPVWDGVIKTASSPNFQIPNYTYTRNAIVQSLSNFSIDVFYPSQQIDLTRQNIIDINSQEFENYATGSDYSKFELGSSQISDSSGNISGTTVKAVQRNLLTSARWEQLYSYYLTNQSIEKIKAGTRLSVNRRTELTNRYLSTNITDVVNTCLAFAGGGFRINSCMLTPVSLFGSLYTMLSAIQKSIDAWNNSNPNNQIDDFSDPINYPQFKWDQISQLIHSSYNFNSSYASTLNIDPFPYARLRYYYIPTVLSAYIEIIALYENLKVNYSGIENTNVDLRYANNPSVSLNGVTFNYRDPSGISVYNSSNYTIQFNDTLQELFTGTYRNIADGKFNEVNSYFKDYEEYLYYRAVYNTNISDPTGRDYIIETNQNLIKSDTTANIADIEDRPGLKERDLTLRKYLILARDPALFVDGASAFFGPVSITQLEGQSPIKVFTSFQFGEEQQVLGVDGQPLTGSDGNVLTTASSLLTLNSKGFEGDLQVTGSIDITGFGPQDGMTINMGNLTMTSDINGFNMPMFNMVNTNDMPYERPQILMSNNISSFLSGTKAYQMGEISFAGPRYDSPEDDKENITIRAQINETVNTGSVNYLAFDFYINEERNPFKNADGSIPEENKKKTILTLGQFGDSQVENENNVSTGMGVRGNIIPLGTYDYSDLGTATLFPTDNTLGNQRFRWGALHLGEESPITFGDIVRTKSEINFDYVEQQLSFSGSVRFDHGLTGSLTKLSDGTNYLRGIDGVTVSTGSSGEVYVGLEGYTTGSERITTEVYSQTGLSGSQVTFNQEVFELANYNDNNIKFYLNGQLLSSGSLQEVSVDKTRDYFIDPDAGSVYFADPIYGDDVLSSVFYNDTSDQRGQYRYDRILSTAQAAGTNVWFNFDFGIIDYDYDKFEVFVNGQQLTRINNLGQGETQPYEITASNRIAFDHDLYARDIITLLFKIPNPFSTSSSDGDGEEESELNSKIKETVNILQDYQALDPVSFTGLSFDLDTYSKDVLNVYHNGQLLLPGSLYHVQVGRADYYIQDDTTIKFADVLRSGDVITFDLLVPGYENAFADTVFVTQNKSLLNNTLQLSGSNSIIVETTSENIIIKNNKELVFNEILVGNANGTNNIFQLSNEPFSPSEISIFVDGALKVPSGSTSLFDYSVSGSQITFNSQSTPSSGSLVMSIYNKVI